MKFLSDSHNPRVAVIGFGYVGCCLGLTLADRGVSVIAIDRNEKIIADLRAGRCPIPEPGLAEVLQRLHGSAALTFHTDYDAVPDADVVLITVGTPVDKHGTLVTDALEQVCRQLTPRLRRGQLVILKSTVSPGTTRTMVAPLLDESGLDHEKDYGLAFCPERLAEGNALAQVLELPVVVGGCGPESAAAAARFWRQSLGVRTHVVPSSDAAEIVKLATNWWIDTNIAVANEVAQVCSVFGVDVLDVIAVANELPKGDGRVNILLPSVGVGGSCLTKDPWMIWRAANDRGVDLHTVPAARRTNDYMPRYTAQAICDELVKLSVNPPAAKVAVLGVAFKSDTGDLRNTPVKGVVQALHAGGTDVALYDPLADPELVKAEFGLAPAPSLQAAVAGANCVAILAGHRQFHDIDFEWLRDQVSMPCLVFDGRIYYSTDTIRRLRQLGFQYRGVGRG